MINFYFMRFSETWINFENLHTHENIFYAEAHFEASMDAIFQIINLFKFVKLFSSWNNNRIIRVS